MPTAPGDTTAGTTPGLPFGTATAAVAIGLVSRSILIDLADLGISNFFW